MKLAALLFAVCAFVATPAFAANDAKVGFEKIEIPNGTEPPLAGGVWYPVDAPPLQHGRPLVVIPHGGGGSFEDQHDTAEALARAGFVAASVSHAGDTFDDQSQVLRLWRRPAQLRRLVTYMLEEWPRHGELNPGSVGAYGFSNGGFTVLVAAGGIPDLARTAGYCAANPEHDLCRALKQAGVDPHLGADAPPDAWIADPRIKAAVIAAPAFGFAFGRPGLKRIKIPIQLWRAADDRHQPNPWFEEAVRIALPRPPEYRVVAGASHYDFLPPCSPRRAAAAPLVCGDPTGFDRAAFHQAFNAQVVRFFRTKLD